MVVFLKCLFCGYGVLNVVLIRVFGVLLIYCNDEVEVEVFVDLEVISGSIYIVKIM